MPKHYRKKPVVIEAVQFVDVDESVDELFEFTKEVKAAHFYEDYKPVFRIETLEGNMTANIGDYIIKGIKGEFYPCRKDIFEESYEEMPSILDTKCDYCHESVKSLYAQFKDGECIWQGHKNCPGIKRYSFSEALEFLKQGKKVKRSHWKGYWQIKEIETRDDGGHLFGGDIIMAFLADGINIAPAAFYQSDVLECDWEVVE